MAGSIAESDITNILRGKGIRCFVETGIYQGSTTLTAARIFERVHGFEIHQPFIDGVSREAKAQGINNIIFHHGDTSEIFESIILSEILEPAFFYLDAHKSWDPTTLTHIGGWSDIDVPLLSEIKAINKRKYADIIVVDDVCMFENAYFRNTQSKIMADWSQISRDSILSCIDESRVESKSDLNDRFVIKLIDENQTH